MQTIAVDPGITTGVAVFGDDDELLFTFTSTQPHTRLVEELTSRDANVVIEQPPHGKKHLPEATDDVISLVSSCAASPAVFIAPSAWKSHPASFRGRKRSEAPERTVHELDACGIGTYYIEVRREVQAGQA